MSKTNVIPLEKAVVARIRRILDKHDAWYFKTNINGMPDIIGCYLGYFFAIEVKRDMNGPYGVTRLQQYALDKIEEHDGYVCVTDNTDRVVRMLTEIRDEYEDRMTGVTR